MSAGLERPVELTEEEMLILSERLDTVDEDLKTAMDFNQYLAELGDRLRKIDPAPR